MNTQNHTKSAASPTRHDGPELFTATPDWRSSFRRTALDLNPELRLGGAASEDQQSPSLPTHWLLEDSSAASLLKQLASDAGALPGSHPSGGAAGINWTAVKVIDALGFANTGKPAGIFAEAAFLSRFTVACLKFSSRSNTHRIQVMGDCPPSAA